MSDKPAPREESLGSYEMLWDCAHCEAKKLLGKTHRHCPNCGAPQDESKRYFPSEADRVKVVDHVYTGVDKKCGSCGAPQSAKATHCGQCGAPLGEARAVPIVVQPRAPVKARRRWGWWVLVAVILLSTLIWWRCIRKREIALQVTGHRWATAVEVEEYREVEDKQWRDEVPTGARALSCQAKKRSTRTVADGEDCTKVQRDKGDGTFEEVNQCKPRTKQEDVDGDWCSFRIDRWTKIEELEQHGTGLTATWAAGPKPPPVIGIGARREGARKGTWTLDLHDGKHARSCDVSEATWRKYADGAQIKAKVRASSGELVCSTL